MDIEYLQNEVERQRRIIKEATILMNDLVEANNKGDTAAEYMYILGMIAFTRLHAG